MRQNKPSLATTEDARQGGKKKPFSPEEIKVISHLLSQEGRTRDLALFRLAISNAARTSDLVGLTVGDILDNQGCVANKIRFKQKKTGDPNTAPISASARQALEALIFEKDLQADQFLFTAARGPRGKQKHISTRTFRDVIKNCAALAKLDPQHYSGHSTRRTAAKNLHECTHGNVEVVRQFLGQSTIAATQEYLGVSSEEAEDLASKFAL